MFVDQTLVFGFCIAIIGTLLFVTLRLRFVRAIIAVRRHIIEDAVQRGDAAKAARHTHELAVIEKRVPKYAVALIAAGVLIMAASAAFLLIRGAANI